MAGEAAEIEARIAATRADLARTLDELAQRLSPSTVARDGKAVLRERVEELLARIRARVEALAADDGPLARGPLAALPPRARLGAAAGTVVALAGLLRRRRARRR